MSEINRRDFNKISLTGILAGLVPGLIVTKQAAAAEPEPELDSNAIPDVFYRCEEEFKALFDTGRVKLMQSRSAFLVKEMTIPNSTALKSPRQRYGLKSDEIEDSACLIGENILAMVSCLRSMLGKHSKTLLVTEPMLERIDVTSRDPYLAARSIVDTNAGSPWMELVSSSWVVWEDKLSAEQQAYAATHKSEELLNTCRNNYNSERFWLSCKLFVLAHSKLNEILGQELR